MDMELETTLLIDCESITTVMEELASRKSIGMYDIIKKGSLLIQDRYFDTESRSLSKDGIALRIRKAASKCLVCIKAKEHIHEWGGIERLEIEHPWSLHAMNKIIPYLKNACGKIDGKAFCMDDPAGTMDRMGLKCIQDRQTDRITLAASHRQDSPAASCAEIALDRVTYRFSGRSFLHHEIEIEAKDLEGDFHLKTIVAILIREFPGTFKRWDHNKLVTGFAIELLLEKGEFGGEPSGSQVLGHLDHEKIESMITEMKK